MRPLSCHGDNILNQIEKRLSRSNAKERKSSIKQLNLAKSINLITDKVVF